VGEVDNLHHPVNQRQPVRHGRIKTRQEYGAHDQGGNINRNDVTSRK
jgi:hypothetical protein